MAGRDMAGQIVLMCNFVTHIHYKFVAVVVPIRTEEQSSQESDRETYQIGDRQIRKYIATTRNEPPIKMQDLVAFSLTLVFLANRTRGKCQTHRPTFQSFMLYSQISNNLLTVFFST